MQNLGIRAEDTNAWDKNNPTISKGLKVLIILVAETFLKYLAFLSVLRFVLVMKKIAFTTAAFNIP